MKYLAPAPPRPGSAARRAAALAALALAPLPVCPALFPTASALAAQTATVVVAEENFRAEPGGRIVAELLEGASLSLGEASGRWREATLEAWIWGRSVREQQAAPLDLLVNAGGENLRAEPNGRRIGRALGGMRLERRETRGDWVRVRRTGWVWSPSLRVDPAPAPASEPDPPAPGAAGRGGVGEGGQSRQFSAALAEAVVLDNPAGDTLARLREGASVEVLEREGDWARIRIVGWTFAGTLSRGDSVGGGVIADLSRDSLQARPEAYRGRLVEWTIQFIALQEAERFRTDFLEGEPFILARGPGEDAGFVYLAVPRERRGEVASLSPLQRIRVLARVRSPSSALTGAPVLDLLEILRR